MDPTREPLLDSSSPHKSVNVGGSSGGAFNMPIPKHSGFFVQLGATMHRQLIQKKRMPVSCCVELFLPVVFILGLVAASKATDITTEPPAQFVVPGQAPIDFPGVFRLAICRNGTTNEPGVNAMLPLCDFNSTNPLTGGGRDYVCSGENGATIPLHNFCVDKLFDEFAAGVLGLFNTSIRLMPFNDFVMLQWAWRLIHTKTSGGLFAGRTVKNALLNSGFLYFTPQSSAKVQRMVGSLNDTYWTFKHVYAPRQYATRDEAASYLTTVDAEGKGWAVLDFSRLDDASLEYEISMNRSASAVQTWQVRDRFTLGLGSKNYVTYYTSGFLSLQTLINDYFMREVRNMTSASGNGEMNNDLAAVPMPYASYKNNVFLTIAGRLSPLVLVLSYLYTVSQLTKRLVEEKELRLREAMLIMGLGKPAFFLSWTILYIGQNIITSIAITIILKVGLLTQSDPTVIFVAYFLFGCSTTTLSTLLSSFFSKSRISALVSPILYFLCSIPSFALPEGTGRGTLLMLSIFSPTAFAQATGLLFTYEGGQGMGWNEIGSRADTINMATAMFMMLFDTVLYALLTVYVDAVFPNEWGARLHPCFCITHFFKKEGTGKGKFSQHINRHDDGNSDASRPGSPRSGMNAPGDGGSGHVDAVEDYPDVDAKCSVHINYLLKEFEAEGGAKVAVDNLELKLFPDQVTALLGHNGAGKSTTINMITGMLEMTDGDCRVYGKSVRHQLQEARAEIGFCPQHNILWPNMTCVEHLRYFARLKGVPSSEIEAQVHTMLQKVDLMPQKDQFSSSLSGGQKRKLSVAIAFVGGSRLVLLDEPTAGCDVAARRFIWDLLREMSAGRTIVLSTHFMDEAELLANRVAIMSKGALHSYGSPMFLRSKLGTGYVLKVSTERSLTDADPLLQRVRKVINTASLKDIKGQEVAFTLPMSQTYLFPQVLRMLEGADMRREFGVTGVSMSVSTLEDVFLRISHEEDLGGTMDELAAASAKASEEETAATIAALDRVFKSKATGQRPKLVTSPVRQFGGMLMKRFHNGRRDRRTICLQVILPLIAIILAMLLAKLGPPPQPRLVLDMDMYGGVPQMLALANCTNQSQFYNSGFTIQDRGADVSAYNLSDFLLATAKQTGDKERYVAVQCNDPVNAPLFPSGSAQTTLLFTNASAWHSLPQILNEYAQTLARMAAGGDDSIVMRVASYPLPWGARQQAGIDSFRALIVGFFTLIPFTFIPSTYVSFIVKERESKAKHLQFVSGANFVMYWLSNYVFDLLSFFVTEIIALIIFAAFKRDEFIGSGEAIGCIIALFTLYGLSSIANSYAVSFLFNNHGSAQNIVMMANFLCGFVLVITIFILKQLESTESAAKGLVFVFRFVPSYCLGEGILALSTAPLLKTLGVQQNVFDLDQSGWALIYMALNFVIFTAITIFLDHPARQRAKQALLFNADEVPPPIENEDPDVARERKEIESMAPGRANDAVVVRGLRKVYHTAGEAPKVAVKNLSFGVKKGEIFGLLGTNGAGKTTTMSILTSEFLPTCGSGMIAGYNVVTDAADARLRLGYCPQFDATLDLMNAEEHLALYAALRGVPSDETADMIDALIVACDLVPHRRTPSKKLSGGNRRKLSLAISLIGAPPVVALDEASAGIDVVSRRKLWDAILYVARYSSVVITTHHLEEVDVLASRVGIMVDGEMRCIGSLERLKQKFGGGFELMVKVATENDVDGIIRFITAQFPSARLIENRECKLTYALPSASTRLSAVFEIMQRARDDPRLAIQDYTVQQSSLEQVFLRISQHQAAIEEEAEVERQQSLAEHTASGGNSNTASRNSRVAPKSPAVGDGAFALPSFFNPIENDGDLRSLVVGTGHPVGPMAENGVEGGRDASTTSL